MPCKEICNRREANIPAGQGAESLPSFSAKRPRFTWPQQPAIRDWKTRLFLQGFTLIELLVVISIIALLLAILMPTLQRVKNQARAVKCQGNLHQWGVIFSLYTQDNDGRFIRPVPGKIEYAWYYFFEAWRYEDLCFCPMAMKVNPDPERHFIGEQGEGIIGSKFTAWENNLHSPPWPYGKPARGSYGMNWFVVDVTNWPADYDSEHWHWNTCLVKRADRIPFFLDCILIGLGIGNENDDPPPYDDAFRGGNICVYAINRHNGGTNGLFMDWSVRKVGLKELWTLKWHRKFDTANRWTIAGGVRPSDWPEWMRKFKDY